MLSFRVFIAITLLSLAYPVWAAVPSPTVIRDTLTKGDASAVKKLAASLGMTTPKDWINRAKTDFPCTAFDAVDIGKQSLFRSRPQVILYARAPSMCGMAFVTILDKPSKGGWRVVDTIRLRERNVTPHISYEKLINPEHSEIVVKNNEVDYGTGIENIRMTIFSVNTDGARVIFDEPMKLNWTVPVSESGKHQQSNQTETDEYNFLDDKDGNGKVTGTKIILRKESIKDHDTTITRWWNYSWDPSIGILMGYQTIAPK